MKPSSRSPKPQSLTCTFRLKRQVYEVRFLCTVHNQRRVSLVIPAEQAIEMTTCRGMDNQTMQLACRVELEKKGSSGWWNIPEGTGVYEKSPYLGKFAETRNCYVAMWLPQLLMRHFLRNEASIMEAAAKTAGKPAR